MNTFVTQPPAMRLIIILLTFIFWYASTPSSAQMVLPQITGNQLVQNPLNGGVSVRKSQVIYAPNHFVNNNTDGIITHLYFRALGNVTIGLQVANLEIKLRQVPLSSFSNNQFVDSLTTVLFPVANRVFTAADVVGSYLRIELDQPFIYDRTQNLLVEVSSNGAIGNFLGSGVNRFGSRLFAFSSAATFGNIDNLQWNLGFDLLNLQPNNARLEQIEAPINNRLQEGKNLLAVKLRNMSPDTLQQLQLNFQWGSQLVSETWTGLLPPGETTTYSFSDSIVATPYQFDTLFTWSALPNGQVDTDPSDDTLRQVLGTLVSGGNYTVGPVGANFSTIQDALNVLNIAGLAGAVVLEIQPGIYQESLSISSIFGTDSLNRLTLRSASTQPNSVTVVGTQAPALTAAGTNWVHVSNINFERSGTQSSPSGVVSLQNVAHWHFDSCRFVVTNNTYLSQPNAQSNFRANSIRQLQISNSFFQEGIYQLELTNPVPTTLGNVLVVNCQFNDTKGGVYQLNGINDFKFHQNRIHKTDLSVVGAYAQFRHITGFDAQFTRNYIDVKANGSLFVFENLNRSSSTPNLFANNVINFELNANGSLIFVQGSLSSRISYAFLYNTVNINCPIIPGMNSGVFHFTPIFSTVYDGVSIRGNIIKWQDGGNNVPLYQLVVTTTLIDVNDNLYDLPDPNKYYRSHSTFIPFQQVVSWDQQSFNKPFELDSAQQYRLIGPDNSRLGPLLPNVSDDFNGNTRNGPTTDLGALELPFIQRPLLVFSPPSSVDSLGPRLVTLQTITQQPGDSVPIILRYKYSDDTNWVSTQAQRISANEYAVVFDYNLLNGAPYGPREIEYYLAYQDDLGAWQSLPFGGNQQQAPSRIFSYQLLPVLAGTYNIGVGGDFPDIRTAISILQNTTIEGHVTFQLTDTAYNLSGAPNIVQGMTFSDTSYTVTLRPANGVHARISFGGTSPGLAIRDTRNFAFLGRDSLNGGGIELTFAGTTNYRFIQIDDNGGLCENIQISQLKFRSTQSINNSWGVYVAANGSSRHRGVEISDNEFVNQMYPIQLVGLRDGMVANNTIGNTTENSRATIFGLWAQNCDNLHVHNNVVEHITFMRYTSNSASGFRFENVRNGLRIINNIIRNIGSDTLWTINTSTTHQISGIRFEGTIDSAQVLGNLMLQVNGPNNRNIFPDPWFDAAGIFDNANSSSQISYAHNTVMLYGTYTGNTKLRVAPITFTNSSRRSFVNNLLANNTIGDSIRLLSSIYFTPIHAPAALLGMTLSHNTYLLDTAMQVSLYQCNDGARIDSLNAWRSIFAQRQQETTAFLLRDVLSSILPAPDSPLVALGQYLKSNARPLPLPPAALVDLNGVPRGGGSVLADIGAYQINSPRSIDAAPPVLSLVSLDTNAYLSSPSIRRFSAQATDIESGVSEVYLSLWDGETARQVPLTRSTGTPTLGTWTLDLPVDTAGSVYSLSLAARDSLGNIGYSTSNMDYTDLDSRTFIKTRNIVSTQNNIEAEATNRSRHTLRFTELAFLRNAPGRTPNFPAYVDSLQNKFLEISNLGTDSINLNGYYISINQFDTFSFTSNMWLAPGGVILFSSGSGQNDFVNLYFRWLTFELRANPFSTQQYLLYSPDNLVIDELIFNNRVNGFIAPQNPWKGDFLRPPSNISGIKLIGMDMNGAANWEVNTVQSPGSIGMINSGIPRQQSPQFQWGGIMNGQAGAAAEISPLPGGRYPITVQSSLYAQNSFDTVLVNVSGSDSTDAIPPIITDIQYSSDFFNVSCDAALRTLTARVQDTGDGSGVSVVRVVMEELNGLIQTRTMRRISGNITNGIYLADFSGVRNSPQIKIVAQDNNLNISDTLALGVFESTRYGLVTSGDTAINLGDTIQLGAQSQNGDREALQLTEVVFFPSGTGNQPVSTYPAGLNIEGSNDAFEITNIGNAPISVQGLQLVVYSAGNTNPIIQYTLPAYTLLPDSQLFLVVSNLTQNAANVFKISNQTSTIVSSIGYGIYLYDPVDNRYLTALSTNGYNFLSSLNIPAAIWSGPSITGTQTRASVFRINSNNDATGWAISLNATTQMNLGTGPSWGLLNDTVQWFDATGALGIADSIIVSPTQNSIYIAQITNGTCTVRDTVFVAVNSVSNAFDVDVLDILEPVSGQTNLSSVSVQARVINRSNVILNNYPMALYVNNQLFASENIQAYLEPGDTTTLGFQTLWQPPLGELHTICVVSAYPGDQNAANDSSCVVTLGRPILNRSRVVSMVSPANGSIVRDSTLVRVRVRNAGTNTLSQLNLAYGVQDITLHTQTFNVFLLPGEEQVVTFNRYYRPHDSTNVLCVWSISNPNESICATVGLSTSVPSIARTSDDVKLYPNPANDLIFVELTNSLQVNDPIQLRDIHGRLIMSIQPEFDDNRMVINTQKLPDGLYFVQLFTGSGVVVKKLLIQQ